MLKAILRIFRFARRRIIALSIENARLRARVELYQAIAVSLMFGVTVTVLIGLVAQEITEARLENENRKLFEDEYGIPNFVRATDEQIGIHNQ